MEPLSPKTPKVLAEAERLRECLALNVLAKAKAAGPQTNKLVQGAVHLFEDPDDWFAAMTCPWNDPPLLQDIVLVECAKNNLHCLIESFLTLMPLTNIRKKAVIDMPGRYGRTALKHAISYKKWQAASMLVRHGANLGLEGDAFGIVRSLMNNLGTTPRKPNGDWNTEDQKLDLLFLTIESLYGDSWWCMATCNPEKAGEIPHFEPDAPACAVASSFGQSIGSLGIGSGGRESGDFWQVKRSFSGSHNTVPTRPVLAEARLYEDDETSEAARFDEKFIEGMRRTSTSRPPSTCRQQTRDLEADSPHSAPSPRMSSNSVLMPGRRSDSGLSMSRGSQSRARMRSLRSKQLVDKWSGDSPGAPKLSLTLKADGSSSPRNSVLTRG